MIKLTSNNHVLRHRNSEIHSDTEEKTDLFTKDSHFKVVKSLIG